VCPLPRQPAIFSPCHHAVAQFDDYGLPVTQLLLDRGADVTVRAKLPGDYERPGEVVECTPLGICAAIWGREPEENGDAVARTRSHRVNRPRLPFDSC
jgi:hypothetical protein